MSETSQAPGAIEPPAHPAPPVLDITPPGRWWAIPFAELWENREPRLIPPSVLIIVALLISGLFYFQKMETTIADVV